MYQPTNIRNDQHTNQPTYQPTNIPTDKQDKRSTNHRAAYRPTNISDRHTNPTTRVLTNQQSTDETTGGICTKKKPNKQTNKTQKTMGKSRLQMTTKQTSTERYCKKYKEKTN